MLYILFISLISTWGSYAGISDYVKDPHRLKEIQVRHGKPLGLGERRVVDFAPPLVEGEHPYQMITEHHKDGFYLTMVRVNDDVWPVWDKFIEELTRRNGEKIKELDEKMGRVPFRHDFNSKEIKDFDLKIGALSSQQRMYGSLGDGMRFFSILGEPKQSLEHSNKIKVPFKDRIQVWAAYVTNTDPMDSDFEPLKHIEMAVTATTAPNFPGDIRQGIFRNLYADKTHPKVSLKLHEFASQVLWELYKAYQPTRYIFVQPLKTMYEIIRKGLPAGTVSLGTREILGALGTKKTPGMNKRMEEAFDGNRSILEQAPSCAPSPWSVGTTSRTDSDRADSDRLVRVDTMTIFDERDTEIYKYVTEERYYLREKRHPATDQDVLREPLVNLMRLDYVNNNLKNLEHDVGGSRVMVIVHCNKAFGWK